MRLIAQNLPRGNQPSPDPDDRVTEAVRTFGATVDAIAAVKRAHLAIPQRPLDEREQELHPRLTNDLASTSSDKLGRLLTQFTAICDYVAYQTAIAEIDSTVAEQILEFTTARTRLEKTGTVQEKADKTSVDPRVRAAQTEALTVNATYTLMATLLKNYERDLSAVSREITRRGNEMERSR